MKRCSRCQIEQPLDEFYRMARAKDRRQAWCKNCSNAATLAWMRTNRDRYNASHREAYAAKMARLRDTGAAGARTYSESGTDGASALLDVS